MTPSLFRSPIALLAGLTAARNGGPDARCDGPTPPPPSSRLRTTPTYNVFTRQLVDDGQQSNRQQEQRAEGCRWAATDAMIALRDEIMEGLTLWNEVCDI